MRLWPRSMLGQVLLVVALALLVAQTISAMLLIEAAQSRRDAAVLNMAALQLVRHETPREPRMRARHRDRGPQDTMLLPRLPRPIRLEWTPDPARLASDRPRAELADTLRGLIEAQGVAIGELSVVERRLFDDPILRSRPRLYRRVTRDLDRDATLLVAALKREGATQWAVARVPSPPVGIGVHRTIIVQTLLIYLLLIGLLFLLIRRIARPLAALAERTETFTGTADDSRPLAEHGPEDVKRLIRAHNAMEARVAALLDEKDVMLGAIGHDLKTPLAALRIRIENVEDDRQRARMADAIEEITRTLDDILSLARVGRVHAPPEKADLAALAASVVEEFEDMGEAVALVETLRLSRPVHLTWLKRALRNLISNAVRYGGGAQVSVIDERGVAVLRVEDNGPGIPADRVAAMLEPFQRGETSRNRATGGAGLGLTLARAIAEQHGGTLALANRREGGLRAEIRLQIGA